MKKVEREEEEARHVQTHRWASAHISENTHARVYTPHGPSQG